MMKKWIPLWGDTTIAKGGNAVKKLAALILALLCLGMAGARAWTAEEFYAAREELPQAVNQALDKLFKPDEEMISAHRQPDFIFLLSEDGAGVRRVFIFRTDDMALDVVSQPLGEIEGVKPSIGSSWELYLQYGSNYCFHRVGGKWLLHYVQFVDDYWVYPDYLQPESIKGEPYEGVRPAMTGRYTGERDLARISASDLPLRFSDAAAKLDPTGYAVVNNPKPQDRLHLRKNPSQGADSLGKFYNGTRLRVLEKQGDWWRVSIGHLEGWMMAKYLVEGTAMDKVAPAFPALDLKEGREGAPRYTKPGPSSDVMADADGMREWWWWRIIGVYEDEWFILTTREGQVYYQPQDWFWPGNG